MQVVFFLKDLNMNIEFVRMCLKNATDEVNRSAEVSDYMKQNMLEYQVTEKRDARLIANWNARLIFVAVGLQGGKIMICKMSEIFMRYETRRLFI